MVKILLFIAFLVAYGVYLGISAVLVNKFLNKMKRINFLENELLIVIPNIFFFASIFIIGRFLNLHLFLISVIFSNLGLILTIIIWNLLGSPKTPFKEIGGWAGGDFGGKNSWLTIITSGLSALVLIAYPIIIGINYFSQDSIEVIRIMTLKFSSILVISTYILMLPIVIGVMTSSFIDEDTRARAFLNQFAGLIAYSLFISLLFWVVNIDNVDGIFQLGNINLFYSPKLLMILIGFLILFLVLPYFIGIQKAKRLRSDYLIFNTKLLDNIIEAINLSTDKNLISNIEKLENEITSEYKQLVDSDNGIKRGLEYDTIDNVNDIPAAETLMFQYYKIARPYDIRINHYDFLNNTYLKVQELKENVEINQFSNEDKTKLRSNYTEHFKSYKDDLISRNEAKGKANPVLWIGILTILSPLTSQIISEIGKYLISIFKTM